jgi:hypothetical protein
MTKITKKMLIAENKKLKEQIDDLKSKMGYFFLRFNFLKIYLGNV